NRRVAAAADERRIFVNAVDDPSNASAYAGGVLRRGGVTVAISTDGHAPALAGLLRESIEELVPEEIETWVEEARHQTSRWRGRGAGARGRGNSLRGRARRLLGDRGAGPRGNPGHAPGPRLRLRRGVGARRGRVSSDPRIDRAGLRDDRRPDGSRHARGRRG